MLSLRYSNARGERSKTIATPVLGAFVKSIRGKSGNSVFAQTKRGTVARDRVLPTAPATPAQQAVRNNMRKDGAAWQALSAANVASWNAAAAKTTKRGKKSGKAYVPSGYQLFTALTTKLYQINPAGTAPALPPAAAFAGDAITVTAVGGTGQVTFTASAANAAGSLTSVVSVPTGYYAVGYRFVNTATGQETAIQPISLITVALSVEDGGAVEAPVSTRAKKAA